MSAKNFITPQYDPISIGCGAKIGKGHETFVRELQKLVVGSECPAAMLSYMEGMPHCFF